MGLGRLGERRAHEGARPGGVGPQVVGEAHAWRGGLSQQRRRIRLDGGDEGVVAGVLQVQPGAVGPQRIGGDGRRAGGDVRLDAPGGPDADHRHRRRVGQARPGPQVEGQQRVRLNERDLHVVGADAGAHDADGQPAEGPGEGDELPMAALGGHGVEAAFTLREGDAYLTLVGDRALKGAYGLHGGHEGAPADHDFTVGGDTFKAPHRSKVDKLYMRQGDGVYLRTPGGGGFEDPAQRDPAATARDRENGFLDDES